MSSRDGRPAESVQAAINRRAIPVLVGSMLLVTGVAVVLGWLAFCSRPAGALTVYAWIVFWTGLAEAVALAVGLVAFHLVSRRITRPLAELAQEVERLTRDGGTAVFRTDGPIAEVNRLSASANELFALRERQTRELRELTRNVLHDLRTPLTHIRHCAELVHEGQAEAVPSMETVAEACDAILNLVDTNAEISANYSGVDPALPEDLDVTEVLLDLADMYAAVAESKRIDFTVSLPKCSVMFRGHRDRLQRLVVNLLDNAFKFTPENGRVVLSLKKASAGLGLCVTDNGSGISETDRPHVFERFYRAQTSRQTPGNGLGLSLAHAIVTFYRGSIECQSAERCGTTFTVWLPSFSKTSEKE